MMVEHNKHRTQTHIMMVEHTHIMMVEHNNTNHIMMVEHNNHRTQTHIMMVEPNNHRPQIPSMLEEPSIYLPSSTQEIGYESFSDDLRTLCIMDVLCEGISHVDV